MAFFQLIARNFQTEPENQVRIEQRVTIRISPRPQAMQPNMLMDLPTRPLPPRQRLAERDIGRCLPIAGIAGVEVSNDNRLILLHARPPGGQRRAGAQPAAPAIIIRASMSSAMPMGRSA